MKFFKVTLNTVGKDNKRVIFIIPPADETDENGNPAYDEDFLLSNTEYKSYIKETKAAVVSVTYILYEADDSTRLNYDELLKNEDKFFKLDQNDYLIEVKKAKPKSNGKKSSAVLYIILGIAAAAVVAMLIYGSSLKKGGNVPLESESDTSDLVVNTNSTSSESGELTSSIGDETGNESTTDLTTPTETSSETETTPPASSTASEPPVTTTTEAAFVLTFDKNGGVGSLNEAEYTGGTVVELPFTASRIGHVLMGWATAPTEPYTLYDNETNKYVMPSAPATLYAIWTAAEYEVTYNYQIGSNAVTSKERGKFGEIIQLRDISNIDSDAGEFIGWGLLPNANEPIQSLTMPDGGIELYAIYKKAE